VAFIDILGFSRMVRDGAHDEARRSDIISAIDRLRDTACQNPDAGLLITYFSDCLVISSERTETGLHQMLQSLKFIAENLLQIDVFIRGGLAVGGIHHTPDIMFGPAMLDAYDIERCETGAVHPTVLLSAEVKADAERYPWAGWFVTTDDAEPHRTYLHFLRSFSDYDAVPRSGQVVLEGPALLVRHYIARRLQAPPGSVRRKAEWMQRYWDETVAHFGVLGAVDPVGDLERAPNAQPYKTRLMLLAKPKATAIS
jgi:hypothetical protein